MKLSMEESPAHTEPEIIIRYLTMDEPLKRVVAAIRLACGSLIGRQDEQSFVLNAADVYYFEAVDGRVFLYTEKEVFETSLRLYEIEAKYEESNFFRASKSVVANLSKIKSVKAVFNGRFEANLKNGEKIIISRQYVPVMKKMLGL
ncbi:MAG: LytTR family transcriptional regulator [Clostridiales bacterium]|jgi:DNA-binding LytR/AlgR family response regulator|nr:LytTR family transcriptional regulator [Clostridiales bacterium]